MGRDCGACGQVVAVGHRCDPALVGAKIAREAGEGLAELDLDSADGRRRSAQLLARLTLAVNDARLEGALDRAAHARCVATLDGYVELAGLSWDDVAAAGEQGPRSA